VTVVDHPPRPSDIQEAQDLFQEARRRRHRRMALSGALVLVAAMLGLFLWLHSGRSHGARSAATSTAATATTKCVASIEPVHARIPHDVAAWAQDKPVIGEGSLWTIRSAISVPSVQYGQGWHLKFPWYTRPNGVIQIHGRRLDGPGTFQFDVNLAWDARGKFDTSTLDFSVPGCWEVTGRYGTSSLRFDLSVGRPAAT
jgi:hypothetical protein